MIMLFFYVRAVAKKKKKLSRFRIFKINEIILSVCKINGY